MKKTIGILFVVAVLIIVSVSLASANATGPVEPQTVQPSAETGEMVDETPQLWFVELSRPPTADGSSLAAVKSDKDAFREDAEKAKLQYNERLAFNALWNGISIAMPASELGKLYNIPGVVAVYPVAVIAIPETTTSNDPELFSALAMTGADIAQSELGYTGAGIKVAVMDTGVDYDHPDLGGCFGPGCRVAFGYDLVGDDFNADDSSPSYNPIPVPDDDPDDCNGHGTHVAGIVGANGVVTGVAPGVTFGAYRVFGCEGSTTADIMLAAMEMALADDMDVLNMSIGSAFSWPQYPTAQGADRLVKRGMVVVASIGNSGANGLYAAGAPGLGEKVIGVASFDNTHSTNSIFEVNGTDIGYIPLTFSGPVPTSGTEEIVFVGRACNIDLPLLANPAGKVALIIRGACSFNEKATNAINAGASAVVIHNSTPGNFSGTLGSPIGDGSVPVVSISLEDGDFIKAQPTPVFMTWTDRIGSFVSPNGGLISSFSSYGLSPDLSVKPDIGAPGGNIYSTVPLEQGGFGIKGGTSMASPHVAGAAALLLEAKPRTPAYLVRDILQNSADPKVWSLNAGLGFLDHVYRQGAGMVDVDDAILTTRFITPGKLALGEGESGPKTYTLHLKNNSRNKVVYDLSWESAIAASGVINISGYWLTDEVVSFDYDQVTVQPFRDAKVKVTITPATGPEYGMYSGYIIFTPQDGGQVYRVPYAGYVGDYQGIQALAPTVYALPWLAYLDAGSYFKIEDDGAVFTLEGDDLPYLLVHFEHQVEQFIVVIHDANTGMPIHRVFNRGIDLEYLGRNSTTTGFFAFAWDGSRIYNNGNQNTQPVPDGDYYLVVKALKALGNSRNPDHWETWTTPMFTIDRP